MALSLRNAIAGMSAREKKMAVAALVAMIVVAVSLSAFLVRSAIGDIEAEIEMRAETAKYVAIRGPAYAEAKAEATAEVRGREKPPPLRSLVDGVVKKIGMPDPDTKEMPNQDHGAAWTEYGVEVSWREVSLTQLTKFMEEVEGNKRRFPIAVTRLEIRKRRPGEDLFDVTMAISTYENRDEAAGADAASGAPSRQGGR